MNAHLAELLAAIGPGLCYGLFALGLLGMRALFKSVDKLLRRNMEAHEEMLARLNAHELRLGGQDLRLDGLGREQAAGYSRADNLEAALHHLAERVTRLEAGRQG